MPQSAQNFVRLIGLARAVRLIDQLGGTPFPVSKGKNRFGQLRYELLADAIGVDAADILTQEYGGEALYIPNCAAALRAVRNQAIHDRFDELINPQSNPVYSSNEAVALLAREHRISDRRVWDILKVLPEPISQQLGMF